MRDVIDSSAEAEDAGRVRSGFVPRRGRFCYEDITDLPEHSFPGRCTEVFTTRDTLRLRSGQAPEHEESQLPHPWGSELIGVDQPNGEAEDPAISETSWEEERERRIYRGRTVRMLRRYMLYSIETGRLPSLLG